MVYKLSCLLAGVLNANEVEESFDYYLFTRRAKNMVESLWFRAYDLVIIGLSLHDEEAGVLIGSSREGTGIAVRITGNQRRGAMTYRNGR